MTDLGVLKFFNEAFTTGKICPDAKSPSGDNI